MNILIIGGGSLGAFYGSRLQSQASVSVICRSNYSTVKNNGYTIISEKTYGTYKFVPKNTFKSIEEAKDSKVEFKFALITTKNVPELEDLNNIIQHFQDSFVILLQNGLGIEDHVQLKFPNLKLASAVLYLGISQPEHGIIKFVDKSIQGFVLGLNTGTHFSNRHDADECINLLKEFYNMAKESGIQGLKYIEHKNLLQPNFEYQAVRWHKTQWNAAFGCLTILTGLDTLTLIEDDGTKSILSTVMSEVSETAKAVLKSNTPFPPVGKFDILEYLEASKGLGKYYPSIQVDYEKKVPFELEVIVGAVIREAEKSNIMVPILKTFFQMLKVVQKTRISS